MSKLVSRKPTADAETINAVRKSYLAAIDEVDQYVSDVADGKTKHDPKGLFTALLIEFGQWHLRLALATGEQVVTADE
jgi:hypothetical protein